jgi:hypothetical protein
MEDAIKTDKTVTDDRELEAELEEIARKEKKYLRPKEIFAYLLADFIGGSSSVVNMQFFWMNFSTSPAASTHAWHCLQAHMMRLTTRYPAWLLTAHEHGGGISGRIWSLCCPWR